MDIQSIDCIHVQCHSNGRGQQFTNLIPSLQQALIDTCSRNSCASSSSTTSAVIVEPDVHTNITISDMSSDKNVPKEESYWIARHDMMNLLHDEIQKQNHDSDENHHDDIGKIEIYTGCECIAVSPTCCNESNGNGNMVMVIW